MSTRESSRASRTLVLTSTFPQYRGDPRGQFIDRHWQQRTGPEQVVRVLAPRTAWCRGALEVPYQVVRFGYAPKMLSTLTGRYGILENIRERPWRAVWLPMLWFGMARALRRQCRLFRPDLVVAHMLLPGGWIAARVCPELGIPFELYGHGTDVDLLLRLPQWMRRRFEQGARRARAVRLPSAEKLARFRQSLTGGLPLEVEPMVHVVQPPQNVRPGPVPAGQTRRILYLGRLTRQKGVDDLLLAVAGLDRDCVLDIAGDGPQMRPLRRLARRLGIRATFHGFVGEQQKAALLAEAQVVCVPSRELRGGFSEGAPLVVREAFAHGRPVVATRVGGIPELCRQGGQATLVAPDAPHELRRALSVVLAAGDPPLREVG